MSAPISHASPFSMRAYAFEMLTLPARTDLISVPVSTRPASNVSSIVNSWRALRLRATVESSRMGWLLADAPRSAAVGGRDGSICPGHTNAGPLRTGVHEAYPPTGCPTKRPSPARWCSYSYCRSLHITSFRWVNRTRTLQRAQEGSGRPLRPAEGRSLGRADHVERLGEDRILARCEGRRHVDRDVRLDADVVDPMLVRGEPLRDPQSGRAARPRKLLPLL